MRFLVFEIAVQASSVTDVGRGERLPCCAARHHGALTAPGVCLCVRARACVCVAGGRGGAVLVLRRRDS
eukprot:1075326-Rhodomonas_salina.2